MAAHPTNVRTDLAAADALLASQLLGGAAAGAETVPDSPGLHVCPACALPFVVPGRTRDVVSTTSMRIERQCTNCDWSGVAVHSDDELAAFEAHLDRSFADLLWTLEVVWTANEEAAIRRFATALGADLILPEDF